ncbi:hypothetical protein [Paraburkholderia sp.]|uniref:hypothetical protein n=1 Tax=Paraburkholderia sp. TaxID=1926495 RepID=UPI003C7A2682
MEADPGDPPQTKFVLGRLFVTSAVRTTLKEAGLSVPSIVLRHLPSDWGDVDAHERLRNDHALLADAPVCSRFTLATGASVQVFTEADRASTPVLLPSIADEGRHH